MRSRRSRAVTKVCHVLPGIDVVQNARGEPERIFTTRKDRARVFELVERYYGYPLVGGEWVKEPLGVWAISVEEGEKG